jgi:A/G-specific adenine glycosylase
MALKNKHTERQENSTEVSLGALFAEALLQWNRKDNKRLMPWKGEKDPYKIWLSEIILQQTRVEQGLKYYENFISTYPDIHSLAKAPEQQVLKLWEGLGYYSRCRNLIATARYVSSELNGLFPRSYESILALKGIGSYTAAAISSFAYNLPHAVLDGNVFRVLSRIFNIDQPIDSTAGKKYFTVLAQQCLPPGRAGEYNQAIMDFGATVCKPSPECGNCFFRNNCRAFLDGRQDLLPVKEKKISVKKRWFNYFIIRYKDEVAIHQRKAKDIWEGLFEFPLIEALQPLSREQLLELFEKQYASGNYLFKSLTQKEQRLTHQQIYFNFLVINVQKRISLPDYKWVGLKELEQHPFPKTLQDFISVPGT